MKGGPGGGVWVEDMCSVIYATLAWPSRQDSKRAWEHLYPESVQGLHNFTEFDIHVAVVYSQLAQYYGIQLYSSRPCTMHA